MIECRDIRKTYQNEGGDTEVLRGISFAIADGEFVSIMGPSGSGKSTLMHILGALDSPSSGGYFLDGQDMSKRSDDELARLRREKIGFVFQAFNLLPRTSVVRNVMLPLIYQEAPVEDRMKQVEASLLAVGLDREHWTHQSNQLSGGQMQRVAIARALVNNPSLILADEPTGNLDTKTGELVLQTFERLNREHGHTIILITHEADVARHADRTLLIRDGLLVSDIQNTPRKK
ncbi:MAG: ABC transporter ATP-binding protein [Candidatus Moranbacteria bacterium]|nr:ABC transporter ATP-binding protein [Candidatus Moranbacteria bacterium]MBP9801404.1 ABC transporter ATP-binding protein [Candidatus Moranbacteria bacterium]